MRPHHSVLVITYRQESMISGCLDSILNQSETPYEVVIADDCSPDGTWAIIKQYAAKYPNIIRAYQNEHNLGVFGNLNKLVKQATGDLVNIVAGDDLLPENILEKYSNFIETNHLDCNDAFVIHTNSEVLKPDGKRILKNNSSNFQENMFEVCALHCFWGWDTGLSIGLMNRLGETRQDMGYQADLLWNFEKAALADKHYFMNEVGYIYRANVGVSVATKYVEHLESKRRVVQQIYKQFGNRITPRMKRYFEFDDTWMEYNAYPSLKTYCHFVKAYIKNYPFPKNNIHHNPVKVLTPIWLKNIIKKIIGRKY